MHTYLDMRRNLTNTANYTRMGNVLHMYDFFSNSAFGLQLPPSVNFCICWHMYRSCIGNIIAMCSTNYEYWHVLEHVLNLFDTDDIFKVRSIQMGLNNDCRAAVAGCHTSWASVKSRVVTVSSRKLPLNYGQYINISPSRYDTSDFFKWIFDSPRTCNFSVFFSEWLDSVRICSYHTGYVLLQRHRCANNPCVLKTSYKYSKYEAYYYMYDIILIL